LIHFIGAPLDGHHHPVFAQIVNRDRLLGLEFALELFQLNYFHDMSLFSFLGSETSSKVTDTPFSV
jgi:hypothetical protein